MLRCTDACREQRIEVSRCTPLGSSQLVVPEGPSRPYALPQRCAALPRRWRTTSAPDPRLLRGDGVSRRGRSLGEWERERDAAMPLDATPANKTDIRLILSAV